MLGSQRATTTFMEKQMKNPKPDTSKSLSTTPTSKKSTKPTLALPPVYWITINPIPDYEASFQQMSEAVEITKKQQNMI